MPGTLDFMIIGVQKGGTTALSSFIDQHPDLEMARGKEVHLFGWPSYSPSWTSVDINKRYAPYFESEPKAELPLRGEATPLYLYAPTIVPELARYNPKLKVIVSLRDPVDRAISQYEMELSRGFESRGLVAALLLESWRLARSGWSILPGSARLLHSYLDRGKYVVQLARLRTHFPQQQILILDNSELHNDHDAVMARVFEFLGVDKTHPVAAEQVFRGESTVGKHRVLRRLLRCYFYWHNRKLRRLLPSGSRWFWL